MRRTLRLLTAIVSPAVLLSSCTKTETKSYAKIRITQVSPDAPEVSWSTGLAEQESGKLSYGAHTAYISMESGSKTLKLGPVKPDTITLSTSLNLQTNQNYSLFLVDSFKKVTALLLTEDAAVTTTNKAKVRFLPLSPDAPALDLFDKRSDSRLFINKAFKDYTGYMEFTPGTYDLYLRKFDDTTNVCHMPYTIFNAGKQYTVLVKGNWKSANTNKPVTTEIMMN